MNPLNLQSFESHKSPCLLNQDVDNVNNTTMYYRIMSQPLEAHQNKLPNHLNKNTFEFHSLVTTYKIFLHEKI
jgi:hypothetical protein